MKKLIHTLILAVAGINFSNAQVNYIDSYINNSVTFTTIATSSNQLNQPRDLDFKPNTNELWVCNYGNSSGGTMDIFLTPDYQIKQINCDRMITPTISFIIQVPLHSATMVSSVRFLKFKIPVHLLQHLWAHLCGFLIPQFLRECGKTTGHQVIRSAVTLICYIKVRSQWELHSKQAKLTG